MKLLRFFVPAAAALLFAQAALAAFPYSSSGGTSTTSLRCSNNPCKTCTSNLNCGGSICQATSYVPPYCMNGYSTVIFDDSDPRLGPPAVNFIPDPSDPNKGELRITGALVASYGASNGDVSGYRAVYRIEGTLTQDDDPAGLKGIRFKGVKKVAVDGQAETPLCSDAGCTQSRFKYSIVLDETGVDTSQVLTGKFTYDDYLTGLLFPRGNSNWVADDPFSGCHAPAVFGPEKYCSITVGISCDPDTAGLPASCAVVFPYVPTTPFGFPLEAAEILRFDEKCVSCALSALTPSLENDPVFSVKGKFEGCDGFGMAARMCNDATEGNGTVSCGGDARGDIIASVGDERAAQEQGSQVTLVYVGPTLQDLIQALKPYGVVNGVTGDEAGVPIFLVATAGQTGMLLPSYVSKTELRFTPAEASGTVITGLNITGWGQGTATLEPVLVESPDTKSVVWDFGGMGLVVQRLVSGSGDATITGSIAPDVILAGNGVDSIDGKEEGDCLDGQQNDDHIWGGPGADVFVLSGSFGRDTIYDFNAAEGDVIVNITGKSASTTCSPATSTRCTIKVSGAGSVTVNLANGGTGSSSIPTSLSGLPQCQGHPAYSPTP